MTLPSVIPFTVLKTAVVGAASNTFEGILERGMIEVADYIRFGDNIDITKILSLKHLYFDALGGVMGGLASPAVADFITAPFTPLSMDVFVAATETVGDFTEKGFGLLPDNIYNSGCPNNSNEPSNHSIGSNEPSPTSYSHSSWSFY